MKIIIWIGCMILNYIVQSITKGILSSIPSSGDESALLIGLFGGILSAASIGLCIWLAITLCKKWDWYNVLKKAAEAEMTVSEYAMHGLSEKFLTKFEEMCNTLPYEQVKPQLKACVRAGKITKEQYIALLKEYCEKR